MGGFSARRAAALGTIAMASSCSAEVELKNYVKSFDLKFEPQIVPDNCYDEGTRRVKHGDVVSIHYKGEIDGRSAAGKHGYIFDSTETSRMPLAFTVGRGGLMPAFDYALDNMCIGEVRDVIIPPILGYGNQGSEGGKIPPNATIRFQFQLVDFLEDMPEAQEQNVFEQIDQDEDGVIDEAEMMLWWDITKQGEEMPPERFSNMDRDGNGKITWVEFDGPKGGGPPGYNEHHEEQQAQRESSSERQAKIKRRKERKEEKSAKRKAKALAKAEEERLAKVAAMKDNKDQVKLELDPTKLNEMKGEL